MRETAVRFGNSASLVGVLAEPKVRDEAKQRPGVILLNSGILHRVGVCRLHVRIARRMAKQGFAVMRFDFSGIGDSPPRRDSLRFEESSVVETREAMDYMARRKGIERFILIGLCSGADVAFEASVEDDRVVGLVQLDAYAYRTPWHYVVHYAPRVLKASVWLNFVRRLLKRSGDNGANAPGRDEANSDVPEYVRVFPPKSEVQDKLRKLVERGVRQFYVYTGGQEEYNYRKQFEDSHRSIDFRGLLRVDHIPEADHIFTGLPHQTLVLKEIEGWACGEWGRAPEAERAPDPAAREAMRASVT